MDVVGFMLLLVLLIAMGSMREGFSRADARPDGSADWIRRKKRLNGWSEERARAEWIRRHGGYASPPHPAQPVQLPSESAEQNASRNVCLWAAGQCPEVARSGGGGPGSRQLPGHSVPCGGESSQGAAEAISDSNAMNALALIPFGFRARSTVCATTNRRAGTTAMTWPP